MADALTIDFALTNWSKVEKAFTSLAKLTDTNAKRMDALATSVDNAASAYSRLNMQIATFNRLSGSGGNSAGSVSSVGSAGNTRASRSPSAPSYVQGPLQRQTKLAQQMQSALGSGNHRAAFDIRLAQVRNNAQIAKLTAPPASLGSKFADVLKSSRFGVSAGGKMELMPLVGRTASLAAEALGPEVMALAGPVGIVIGVATAAATAIFNLAKGAAEAGAAFTSFQFSVGNMGAGASSALAIGRQGGLDAGATSGQANSFQQTITGSALGRAYGMRLGQFNIGGVYGNQDYATQYAGAIAALRKMPMEERIRTARAVGLEGSLSATMTSDKQYAYTKTDAAVHSQIFDPAFAQKSADFNAALGRVSDAASNLMTVLGKPFLDGLTNFFNRLADAINGLASFLNSPTGQAVLAGLSAIVSPLSGLSTIGGGDTVAVQATRDNTKATQDLTKALAPGIYGRDSDGRLGNAFSGASGQNAMAAARQAYVSGGVRLGAF